MSGGLTGLQRDVLRLLSDIVPRWRLSGGGALVGFHGAPRTTRDLDLFWSAPDLTQVDRAIEARLAEAGLVVSVLERSPAFRRLRVARESEVLVVDLVANSLPWIVAPEVRLLDGAEILVDSLHELLVNKLCALLSRSELRDLDDVHLLLSLGGDLQQALVDASRKDAGFSPLTLAWVLEQFPVAALGRGLNLEPGHLRELVEFKETLVEAITRAARPPPA